MIKYLSGDIYYGRGQHRKWMTGELCFAVRQQTSQKALNILDLFVDASAGAVGFKYIKGCGAFMMIMGSPGARNFKNEQEERVCRTGRTQNEVCNLLLSLNRAQRFSGFESGNATRSVTAITRLSFSFAWCEVQVGS
jgi:hypothetical protein